MDERYKEWSQCWGGLNLHSFFCSGWPLFEKSMRKWAYCLPDFSVQQYFPDEFMVSGFRSYWIKHSVYFGSYGPVRVTWDDKRGAELEQSFLVTVWACGVPRFLIHPRSHASCPDSKLASNEASQNKACHRHTGYIYLLYTVSEVSLNVSTCQFIYTKFCGKNWTCGF